MVFNLNGSEYIELIKLLKLLHIAQSGGHAKIMVEEVIQIIEDVQSICCSESAEVGMSDG